METKIEKHFNTKNDYWNENAFEIYKEAFEQGIFKDLETPLNLFEEAFDVLISNTETPVKALQLYDKLLKKHKLNDKQEFFIRTQIEKYFRISDFDVNTAQINDLLSIQLSKLKKQMQPETPRIDTLRSNLKAIIQNEVAQLPETLKDLEPVQRLNVLTKLMPYVFPKVEAVSSTNGEPTSFSNW